MENKKSINEIQKELLEEFSFLDDWMDRYALIIEMGNELKGLPEKEKTPQNLIEGCQSRVWIVGQPQENGTLALNAESDAVIVKGMIAMLLRIFDGQPAKDIVEADLSFIKELGLQDNLSPTRSNGLSSMIRHIKLLASKMLL